MSAQIVDKRHILMNENMPFGIFISIYISVRYLLTSLSYRKSMCLYFRKTVLKLQAEKKSRIQVWLYLKKYVDG